MPYCLKDRKAKSREYYLAHKAECIARAKEWKKANPKKVSISEKKYRKKNQKRIIKQRTKYRLKNRLLLKERGEELRRKLKAEVYAAYGDACNCCGESIPSFLTIDHIKNDGNKHRKEVQAGYALHRWLKKMGFPKKNFRLLCWNCNVGRHHNRGVCPHKQKSK